MAGKIRTREVCPNCGKKFQVIEEEKIWCPDCKTIPQTYYIYLYWPDKELGRDHKITRDKEHILDSFRGTKRLLEKIRHDIDSKAFVLRNYLPKESNAFIGKKLFPKWLAYIKEKSRALNYTRKIEQYIEDYFTPTLGDTDCTDIKTKDISAFRSYLYGYKKKDGKPLSPKTIKNVLDQAKSFCKWLYREEYLNKIPIFDPVEVPETLPTIMPLEDRRKVFAVIRSIKLYNALSFYAYHPVRSSEVGALDVKHFDLKYRVVKVENGMDYDNSIKTRKYPRTG